MARRLLWLEKKYERDTEAGPRESQEKEADSWSSLLLNWSTITSRIEE